MPCKTRQAALRGERSKPHYYLPNTTTRAFDIVRDRSRPYFLQEDAIDAFEARIDWSTWGASR